MDIRSVLFSLLVVLFSTGEVASQKPNSSPSISVKTLSINCVGNPDLVVNITCKLKPINWQKTYAVMDSDLVGVLRNVTFNLKLFKWTHTNQFRPYVMNITVNMCNMLGTGRGNPYAKPLLKMIRSFSSLNHQCPFSGHLAARDIYMDSSILTFPFPIGKYKFKLLFYEGWPLVHIATVEAIFLIVENTKTDKSEPRKQNRDIGQEKKMGPANDRSEIMVLSKSKD